MIRVNTLADFASRMSIWSRHLFQNVADKIVLTNPNPDRLVRKRLWTGPGRLPVE